MRKGILILMVTVILVTGVVWLLPQWRSPPPYSIVPEEPLPVGLQLARY